MRFIAGLMFVVIFSGCSSLKGVQRETCDAAAAVIVPLFCPIDDKESSDGSE